MTNNLKRKKEVSKNYTYFIKKLFLYLTTKLASQGTAAKIINHLKK